MRKGAIVTKSWQHGELEYDRAYDPLVNYSGLHFILNAYKDGSNEALAFNPIIVFLLKLNNGFKSLKC